MSGVRVLVGTRKGAFILTADGKRDAWKVSGPHFAGWEVYHVKGSPVDPDRIYASQSSGWFGQLIQRSDDGGRSWETVGNEFAYDGVPGTHQWYDGTPHPWEFKRVWHLEPSLTDPDTAYAGVEDAALFMTIDGGRSWAERASDRGHPGNGGGAANETSSREAERCAGSLIGAFRLPRCTRGLRHDCSFADIRLSAEPAARNPARVSSLASLNEPATGFVPHTS